MSRTLFFPLLCLCMLVCTAAAQAQRAVVSPDKGKGSFEISNQGPAPISVRYSITPAFPDNLTLQFQSSKEFTLNAHIVNAKGQEILPVAQTQVTGRFAQSLNVATLQPGHYFLEIQNAEVAGSSYRVPFDIAKK